MSARLVLHVAVAILRRGDEIVLVHQGAPGEPRHWSLPGGILEEGEVVTEALVREVREETGVSIGRIGPLACLVHVDSRRPPQVRGSVGDEVGYGLTVWIFEIAAWDGAIAPADPDGVVHEAALVHRDDALTRLGDVWWHGATVRYLRGDLPQGTLLVQRWHEDGGVEDLATISPPAFAAG